MIKKSIFGLLVLVVSIASLKAQNTPKIFKNINSEYDEQNPVLTPDGHTLYFTRSHHPGNVGGMADKGDIWYSSLQVDKTWSTPKNAKALNNREWNGVLGFSSDGSTIFLYNHYKESNGIVKTQGIAKASRQGSGWSSPKDIEIPYFKNLSGNHGGYLSQDGRVLVMSLESYGTKGGEDIYVIRKKDNGEWGEPRNLGSAINTKFQEFSPSLSEDNKTLYFSSNGRGGQGSSDIFLAERLDDSWMNWSKPVGLNKVNTKGREKDYRPYDKFALFASTSNSDGYSDLKMYTEKPIDSVMLVKNVEVDTTSSEDLLAEEDSIAEEAQYALFGLVSDADNKNVVNAIITIEADGYKQESAVDEKGYYLIAVPAGGSYETRVDAPGYIGKRSTVDINNKQELNYALQSITVGTTVNLENVLFEKSTPNIIETSFSELDLVVDLMRQNPSMKIRLEGHTDNRGLPKHNLRLSKKRAEAVENYLVKKGISSKRISWKGYGGTKPIADNENPETRKLNRRVEFTIVKE